MTTITNSKVPAMAMRATFARFTHTASVIDLRPDDMTRRARCERFARRNKTCGKLSRFVGRPLWPSGAMYIGDVVIPTQDDLKKSGEPAHWSVVAINSGCNPAAIGSK